MIAQFTLPVTAVDILGDWLGVTVRVFPLNIPQHGHTQADRERLATGVWHNLSTSGLTSNGHLVPELEDGVRTIGRAQVSAAMVLATATEPHRAVRAGSDGQHAAIAVQDDEAVSYTVLHPSEVVSTLIGLVPAATPLPGRSVSFPGEAFRHSAGQTDRAVQDEDVFVTTVLEDLRPAPNGYAAQREIAERMMHRSCRQGGTVIVFGRDPHGRECAGAPLVWRDTDEGRFMSYMSTNADGTVWESFAPADTRRLAQHIVTMWTEAAGY